MEISGALNQYMNICRDAFNGYTAKLNKSTKYVVMETLLLFMVLPGKIFHNWATEPLRAVLPQPQALDLV